MCIGSSLPENRLKAVFYAEIKKTAEAFGCSRFTTFNGKPLRLFLEPSHVLGFALISLKRCPACPQELRSGLLSYTEGYEFFRL